jgi:hypothetical protein
MPFVSGFLRLRRRGGGGPTDPDYGIDEGAEVGGGLPGEGGGGGEGIWGPGFPDHGFNPDHPSHGLPGDRPEHKPLPKPPGYPEHGLPPIAGHLPAAPPLVPGLPIYPVPPGSPEHPITPPPPGSIWPPILEPGHPLPPGSDKTVIAVCYIRGVGWRYVAVDLSAEFPSQGLPLPGAGGRPPGPGTLPGR